MYWAHSTNLLGKRHRLEDHLRGTAELAKGFAESFGAGALGYGAGMLHDVGKCDPKWQRYLCLREAGVATSPVNHKTVGAWMFSDPAGAPGLLALLGHHSGMPDHIKSSIGDRTCEQEEWAVRERLAVSQPELEMVLKDQNLIPPSWSEQPDALEMRIRMLHSSLVDADYLDTAAHFNAEPVAMREASDFGALFDVFLARRQEFLTRRPASPIDAIRQGLFEDALMAAENKPGIYRMPGPTGSGKTISGTAFALRHAAIHEKSRVIVAVPYLAITTQNASVLRSLVGTDNLIEQHSAVEPRERAKLGADNWDAPVVVTTTVQLFESLLSNKPGKARKLHNLVNSVIVLDELQAIPLRVLPVITDVLRVLVRYFGVTVLLSSATQPAWDQLSAWRDDREIEVRDVVADPSALFRSLRRCETTWIDVDTATQLADLIRQEPTALVVVNKTAQARELARLLVEQSPHPVLHLSTRMYPAHRSEVLQEVRRLLAAGLPFHLVSTQLIEAGVDLDFPAVFRLMAPAENLQQAAGRCNREGKLPSGRLVVVNCAEWTPLRDYITGIAKTNQYFRTPGADIDDPEVLNAYFVDYYRTMDADRQAEANKINANRQKLHFFTAAREFRMIEDDSLTVVVGQVPQARDVLTTIASVLASGGAPGPELWRRLQQFCVSLPDYLKPLASLVEELPGVLVSGACYDLLTGIDVDARGANDSIW